MIHILFRVIKIIHSDRNPRQICLGCSLGMVMGLTPLMSAHNLLILLAILLFRVNISAAIVSFVVFSGLAVILDPLFHQLGLIILTQIDFLTGIWTVLYNAPLIPYTRFNNSIIMGSLVASIILFYPLYRGGLSVVMAYRKTLMERFNQWKIVKIMKATNMYKLYARYRDIRG